jgi:excinuclease ABC subunit C
MNKITKALPAAPGIYLFKDTTGMVIYIGKAKSIKNRVSSYFLKQYTDWKVKSLMAEQADIDFILTKNETEALLLEAQLIKEHKPKFNVLLKEGQPYIYLLFTQENPSQLTIVRNKKAKGTYFGPFLEKIPARKTYNYLIKTFQLQWCNKKVEHGCLDYHLGRCAGNCRPDFDQDGYLFRLSLAQELLNNKSDSFKHMLEEKITEYAKNLEFEKAKHLRDYLENIDHIFNTLHVHFYETKFARQVYAATTPVDALPDDYDEIASELQELLSLEKAPITIDCFDISHFQGASHVGSCVRFARGKPDKNNLRRFRIKTVAHQDDYAALQEIVSRRYRDTKYFPDLIVIDGGKGQRNAILSLLPIEKRKNCVSLAKREETIFCEAYPEGIRLDLQSDAGRLLIALRDYTHHFAISYHAKKRKKDLIAR